MFKKYTMGLMLALMVVALMAACAPAQEAAAPADEGEEAAESDAGAEEAGQPGEGVEVVMGQATWDTGWFQAAVFKQMMEELGYTVQGPETLDNPVFYTGAAEGDVDFWANGWFPNHDPFLEETGDAVQAVGFQVQAGALQGYLIDAATAEANGITNLGDLADPEIASIIDIDGNGQADLIGCNAGWGCEAIINSHLEMFELGDTVEHVQGEYSALMADTIGRYERGEPVLFYTWTPNWTVSELSLGDDVVWLGVPDDPAVEAVAIPNCQEDPCDMGFAPNDIRVVASTEFLNNNPAAATLFELVEIPLADIAEQNVLLSQGEDSPSDIERHAATWIEDNRALVDGWLEEARAAAQ
ncbi:MAG: glycine betaine/L-proline ABC transporter substrate-binding protein ProX [Chloroflexi bacterium]|nr:glycine betaine/L-proline ABC transporter substrate-binding protein ProX [Chloroflexota bacterium]